MENIYEQIKKSKSCGAFDWLEQVAPKLYHELNLKYAIFDFVKQCPATGKTSVYEFACAHFDHSELLRNIGKEYLTSRIYYKALKNMSRAVTNRPTLYEEKPCEPTRKRIFDAIREQPNISVKELSTQIGVCERVIQRHLSALIKQGFIRRVNGNRKGKFEIL